MSSSSADSMDSSIRRDGQSIRLTDRSRTSLQNDSNEHKISTHIDVAERPQGQCPANDKKTIETLDIYPKFDNMSSVQTTAILLSLGLSLFMFATESTIVATSVSSIGSALNVQGSLTWITTSYLLTTTVFQPIADRAGDALGSKPLLIASLWAFIAGNIVAGSSRELNQLIAGRLISGIGGAGILSLCGIIISQLTHERQRGSYMNIINLVFIVCDSVGPILGGALANAGKWRWIFLFTAPFGPIITFLLYRALHLPPSTARITSFRDGVKRVDLLGMLMIVLSLSFVIVSLNLGGQTLPWNAPTIIGCFSASFVSFVAFVVVENFAELPVAPMHLFVQWRWRNVPIMIVNRCLLFFHLFSTTFYMPVFLQVIGVSTINSGALVIPFLVTAAISSTLTSYVAHKYGVVRPLFLAALVILPVGMGLLSRLRKTSALGEVIGYSLIAGLGFGSGTNISMVIAQVGLPADVLPTVTALVGSTANLGGVLGVGIIGTITHNAFRSSLSRSDLGTGVEHLNLVNVVEVVRNAPNQAFRDIVVDAYVHSWRLGCIVLASIGAFQFLLCLFLRPVVFDHRDVIPTPIEIEKAPAV